MDKQRVFGIGYHKTGTTTLGKALEMLGYTVCGPRIDLATDLMRGNTDEVVEIVRQFDAVQDNPWPILFRELDEAFPNSKFILTIRDEDNWINSAVRHFGTTDTAMRTWIYGIGHPEGNEDLYLKKYNQHNEAVQDYFRQRPEDLLIVDWSKNSGWSALCAFLGHEEPKSPFPHANKGAQRDQKKTGVKGWLQRFFG